MGYLKMSKIKQYRKLPVTVEAIEFKVTKEIPCKFGIAKEYNSMDVWKFMGFGGEGGKPMSTHFDKKGAYIEIDTLEGVMRADIGDYIIKGVHGEFYPCKPDVFHKTYEPVN